MQNKQNKIYARNLIKEYGSLIALVFLVMAISIVSKEFRTLGNLLSLLRQSAVNGLIAFGMTMVILTGGIDLSVGSTLALSVTLTAGLITKYGVPVPLAMAITLVLGLALGAVSGLLVTVGRIQPFIATLVTMTIYRGATLIYSGGKPVSGVTNSNEYAGAKVLEFFGRGSIVGIPFPVIIFVIAFFIFYVYLNKTTFGRKVYALGSNQNCAILAGVDSRKVRLVIYSVSGFMASLAGLILLSRLGSAQPTLGTGFEMDAIAAVALGGTSMSGGRGKVTGTLIGILIIAVLNNGLNILGVSSYWQDVVKGMVILLAVLSDSQRK